MQKPRDQSLGQEDPLEKEMVTHSSILAWGIPRSPGRLQSTGSQRVRYNWVTSLSFFQNENRSTRTYCRAQQLYSTLCNDLYGKRIWKSIDAWMCERCSVMSNFLRPYGLYSPWNSPGLNTGVDSHSLLQGIFPTQGSNPGLLHCRWILYQLSHQGSPRILDWVAYPFSSGSSWPRNLTRVSYIAGRFFTNWATREALIVN